VTLALLAAFLGGYNYARWEPQPQATGTEESAQPASPPTEAPNDYALLYEIRGLVETEFYRPANADRQKLLHGAARGMVQALDDPNSVYEPPVEREIGDSRWTGRYEGVGMYVDHRDGLMVVTAPVEGGPADQAGVRPADVVIEVDGRAVAGLSLTEQVLLVRGPKGTTVTLTIRRQGAPDPLKIAIVRDEIHLISARSRVLDNGLGVVRISQFTEATVGEARAAVEALLAAQPPGLLLDLRGNGGGLLEPAVHVAGYFLGPGPVVFEVHADGERKTYAAPDSPAMTNLPMIVLVDRGTASATEILAAALRDRGRAELVGERTYGKNTVQYIHRLSEGSGLRLTVAEWHTPSGHPIPQSGLEPDLPIAANPSEPGRDAILEGATRRLFERIGGGTLGGQTPSEPQMSASEPATR
jgi:carboxyl-terminal processing protease